MAEAAAGAGAVAGEGEDRSNETLTSRMYRVRKTVSSMLRKRGYNVQDEDVAMDLAAFKEKFGTPPSRVDMQLLVSFGLDLDTKIMVFFPEDSVNVKAVDDFSEKMKGESVTRGIVVVETGQITSQAKKALMAVQGEGITLEHFRDEELLVDITEHELVPEHRLLTTEEKKALLDRYKLQEQQLPRIYLHDPIARFYGLRRGDVVKIIRASETAGRYVTYRLAI